MVVGKLLKVLVVLMLSLLLMGFTTQERIILLHEERQQIWVSSFEELGIKRQQKARTVLERIKVDFFRQTEVFYNIDEEMLQEKMNKLCQTVLLQPRDAYFYIGYDNVITIIAEQDGEQIQYEQMKKYILQHITGANLLVVPLPIEKIRPNVTASNLEQMHIEQVWAQYTTEFYQSESSRIENIWLASTKISEIILQSNEIFSFNEIVGPRTKENGYHQAGVIVNQQKARDYGGGVCQVSSTLYNAVREAGLEIVERHQHSLPVPYVPADRDAAVVYGLKDFKFRNNTPYPIMIKSYFSYGKLTVKIFGATTLDVEKQ